MFIYQKRVDDMLEKMHEENEKKREDDGQEEYTEPEKNDRIAMALAGIIVLLPVILTIFFIFFVILWVLAFRFA